MGEYEEQRHILIQHPHTMQIPIPSTLQSISVGMVSQVIESTCREFGCMTSLENAIQSLVAQDVYIQMKARKANL